MKIINSYDEYSKIISPKMKKIFYTNNFLSENEVKTEIQAKSLYYTDLKEDVYIFRKRKNHFIMNYYTTLNGEMDKLNENIVTEIAYKTYPKDVIYFFEKEGMKKYIKRVRLSRSEEGIFEDCKNVLLCEKEDAKEVFEILNKYFDEFSGCIPTYEGIEKDIENKNVYVYKKDRILGILHSSDGKFSSEIKHLVVLPEYRNKGIARSLISKYLNNSASKNKRVWTRYGK